MPFKDPDQKKKYHDEYNRKWYEKNRERVLKKASERQRNDPQFREAQRKNSRKFLEVNRENINARRREFGEPRSEEAKARRKLDRAERSRRRRIEAIEKLGGRCESCGIDDNLVLQFDHRRPVLRNANQHGLSVSCSTYIAVLKSDRPEIDYALLCANCHIRKTRTNGEYRGYRERNAEGDTLH